MQKNIVVKASRLALQRISARPASRFAGVLISPHSSREFQGHVFPGVASNHFRCFSTEASPPSDSVNPRTNSNAETLSFQAETRKLLDIVTHSIYTDKEVFLRELVSNSSDALEKFRYYHSTGVVQSPANTPTHPLEINIITNEEEKTLTIVDNGIGMTRDELISNLGTIARSGSKQFVEQLSKGEGSPSSSSKEGIIGQFGVGFYSSFMVADSVSVESLSAQAPGSATRWSSDGSGVFNVEGLPSIESVPLHGSRVTMKLREDCKEYCDPERIKTIIKHYSNFVSFPIKVNGEVVNTVQAIWLKDKKEITKEEYNEFYKYVANAGYDEPKFTLHFRTDAPIDLKCILFVPSHHSERFGMGTMEAGVNLYSRKVLIESKPKDLLPDWLRFLRGVVDSEDLPLSLSREKPQDSNLLRRIREVLVRKFLKFLEDEQKKNPEEFLSFYSEYHMFLKQGICQDYKYMDTLSKLIMFESSAAPALKMVTLDDYISRCPPEQKEIYYLSAPNREAALASPYYEAFKKHNREVLLLYNTVDDFVMGNIRTYSGRNLVSAETSSINFDETHHDNKDGQEKLKLTEGEAKDMCEWFKMILGEKKVREVRITHRLHDSPAIVTDHQSSALRRMMKFVENSNKAGAVPDILAPQVFEINPAHPVIVQLFQMKNDPNSPAGLVADQLFDNALMSAGLLEDPRSMIPRLNDILLRSLKQQSTEAEPAAATKESDDQKKEV